MRVALATETQSRADVANAPGTARAADRADPAAAKSAPEHIPASGRSRQAAAPRSPNRSVVNDVTLLVLLVISILVLSVVIISNQSGYGPSGPTPDRLADVEKTKQEFVRAQAQDAAVQPGGDEAPAADSANNALQKADPDKKTPRSDPGEERARVAVQAPPAEEQEAADTPSTAAGDASQ